ncbi:DUF309 domain-containing protein [Sulfurimonas sp.]|uniref:DUF309 domain-containing protein n=1 Tax=Sulfurimonas sp. TaxID=2022749 RepID=UPI002AB00959|nr:DUF309 domain-containing protein [Sulfurimonas sp.]
MNQERVLTKHLDDFLLCLEEGRYYDAHEALEIIWFPRRFEDDNEMRLLKGFINASVSLELKKRGKKEASQKVWKTYLKYKPLIYKIDSPHLKKYYKITQYLDKFCYNSIY